MKRRLEILKEITNETVLPLSLVGSLLFVFAIIVTDHNKLQAVADEKKSDHEMIVRLDKKVSLILIKSGIHFDDSQ